MKPSVLSVGIGIGVLMLGGSGVAIPTLWSVAQQAKDDREALQVSWHEQRAALVASEEAREAAAEVLETLQQQREEDQARLAAADEAKRILTTQLAEIQARNRELTAVRGTLELRDQEVDELVQQVTQLQSDNASLLAERASALAASDDAPQESGKTNDPVPASADTVALNPATGAAATSPAVSSKVKPSPSAVADGSPAKTATSNTVAPAAAIANSQTTGKPTAVPPVLFDDSGWTSASTMTAPGTVYTSPLFDFGIPNTTLLPASSSITSPPVYHYGPAVIVGP